MPGECNQVLWRGVQPVEGISGIWPSRNAERLTKSISQVGNGTSVLYKVPADTKAFVSSGGLASRLAVDGSHYARVHLFDNLGVWQVSLCSQFYDLAGQLVTRFHFSPALEAVTDWEFRVYSSDDSLDVEGLIFGWLEDV